MKEAGDIAVVDLKEEIEDAANRVKDEIPDKMKKIRNDVVKEMTGKRLVCGGSIEMYTLCSIKSDIPLCLNFNNIYCDNFRNHQDEIMEKKRERKEVRLQKKAAMMKKVSCWFASF